MASILARLWSKLSSKKSTFSIMLIGLDNSGKTSILNHLMSSSSHSICGQQNSHQRRRKTSSSQSFQHHQTIGPISSNLDSFDDFLLRRQGLNLDAESVFNSSFGQNCSPSGGYDESGDVVPTIGYNYREIHYKGLTITVLDFSGQSRYRCLWQEFYNSVDGIVFVVDSSDFIRLVVVRDELDCMLGHPYFASLGSVRGVEQKMGENEPSKGSNESMKNLSAANSTLAQKQVTISQGKLVQFPLDSTALATSKRNQPVRQSDDQQEQQKQQQRTKIPILFLANKTDLPNSADTEVIVKALNLNQLPSDRHPWLIRATSVTSGQSIGEGFDWLASHLVTIPR